LESDQYPEGRRFESELISAAKTLNQEKRKVEMTNLLRAKSRQPLIVFVLAVVLSVNISYPSKSLSHSPAHPVSSPALEVPRLVTKGLLLSASQKPTTKTFGWGAVAMGLKSAPTLALTNDLIDNIQQRATKDNTLESLRGLSLAYAHNDEVRYDVIRGFTVSAGTAGGTATTTAVGTPETFAAAVISAFKAATVSPQQVADLHDVHWPLLDKWSICQQTAASLDLTDRDMCRFLKFEPTTKELISNLIGQSVPVAVVRDAFTRIDLANPTLDETLLAITLVKMARFRQAELNSRLNLPILEVLNSWTAHPRTKPSEKLVFAVAVEATEQLSEEIRDQVSVQAFDADVPLSPTIKSDPQPDRTVNLDASGKLDATFKENPLCVNCDRNNVPAQRRVVDAGALVRISRGVAALDPDPALTFPEYKCFRNSLFTIGVCFGKIEKTNNSVEQLPPTVSVYNYGVNHREWLPGATLPGESQTNDRPHYVARVGFKPAAETNWIAVRWKSNDGIPNTIKCTSGVLDAKPVALEPDT
jgi:hypothetical protein